MSAFINAMNRGSALTRNGAVSNAGSNDNVLDYFAKCGTYRSREQLDVDMDMAMAWGTDPLLTLKAVFYNRAITRKSKDTLDSAEEMTRGQGNKDEFIRCVKWMEENYPETLYANLWAIPTLGCWKDLWYDSASTGLFHYINTKHVYRLIKAGMKNSYHAALLAKYLPKIRSSSAVKNDRHRRLNKFAKGLCSYLDISERDYRKFKSSPTFLAHKFQRDISAGNWSEIDWNMVPGKALFSLSAKAGKDGKTFVERHGLETSYMDWLKKQPVAKFTGYVFELMKAYSENKNAVTKMTVNKQFEGLLEKARTDVSSGLLGKNVFCALDTSGSMGCHIDNNCTTAYDVCVSLGVYFASLNTGAFKNNVIMFDSRSTLLQLPDMTFTDKVDKIRNSSTAWGSTNFQSVIDEIVRIRKANPSIPVEDYPEVLLVVSDMQFCPTGSQNSNYEEAMRKLRAVGLNDMTIIWWCVNSGYSTQRNEVPSTIDDAGTVLISGFDGAIVTSILGGVDKRVVDEKTGEVRKLNPYEMMLEALNQSILNRLVISS